MLLFLTANMAAVTSRANQQYSSHLFIKKGLFDSSLSSLLLGKA